MKKTIGQLLVVAIACHAFKTELDSAELRQTITSVYPTRQANSEGLFSEEEYGLAGKEYESTRVAWIDVPKGSTIEEVQARIDAFPKACIKRIMSMKPILSEAQTAGIAKGLTTLETIAERQLVKDNDGNIVLYNGCKQYKKNQASWAGDPDIDLRPARVEAAEANVVIAEEVAVATA